MRLAFLYGTPCGQQETVPADFEVGDLGAQHLVGKFAVRIGFAMLLGEIAHTPAHHARQPAAAGNVGALVLEQALADGPALAFLADEVFLGHLHIGKEGFAERARAADHGNRADLDAGCVHVDQHEADAAVLVGLVGADDGEALVGPLTAAGPGLLTIDDVMVALVLGKGLQVGEVGPCIGFRIALAPADLASADRGDVFLLLRFIAVFEQGGAEHHHAHAADRVVGARLGEFLVNDLGLSLGQAAAAVFLGPGGRTPAARAHCLAPCLLGGRFIGRTIHPSEQIALVLQFFREIVAEELLHFSAESLVVAGCFGLSLGGHLHFPES